MGPDSYARSVFVTWPLPATETQMKQRQGRRSLNKLWESANFKRRNLMLKLFKHAALFMYILLTSKIRSSSQWMANLPICGPQRRVPFISGICTTKCFVIPWCSFFVFNQKLMTISYLYRVWNVKESMRLRRTCLIWLCYLAPSLWTSGHMRTLSILNFTFSSLVENGAVRFT